MKVWTIMLKGETEKWLIRAYSKKEKAVAEMHRLYDQHLEHEPNAVIELKESDDVIVITLCSDNYAINDTVVMMELEVDGFQKFESEQGKPCIPHNSHLTEQENE